MPKPSLMNRNFCPTSPLPWCRQLDQKAIARAILETPALSSSSAQAAPPMIQASHLLQSWATALKSKSAEAFRSFIYTRLR